jgi:hypothetical protein
MLRPTLYSPGMWATEVRPNGNDTAYTANAMVPHTDGCYWEDQPGLQVPRSVSLRVCAVQQG